MIRVLLVGDEAIVREGLRMRLTRVPDIKDEFEMKLR
jgi:hypothetical protein